MKQSSSNLEKEKSDKEQQSDQIKDGDDFPNAVIELTAIQKKDHTIDNSQMIIKETMNKSRDEDAN